MLSCKDFLGWLNDYLDDTADPGIREHLQEHVTSCPNCWVIFDTTKKTIQVYKGMEPRPLPEALHDRLIAAIEKTCTAKKAAGNESCDPPPTRPL
ncbi:MAG: zf-HC2 domain-containing protein [Bryobacteraceae bacterium]